MNFYTHTNMQRYNEIKFTTNSGRLRNTSHIFIVWFGWRFVISHVVVDFSLSVSFYSFFFFSVAIFLSYKKMPEFRSLSTNSSVRIITKAYILRYLPEPKFYILPLNSVVWLTIYCVVMMCCASTTHTADVAAADEYVEAPSIMS